MDKPVQIVFNGDNPVEAMKLGTSVILTQWLDAVLEEEKIPEEVDFDSREEYQEAVKEFMLNLIEEVRYSKHEIFKSVLDCYNQLLHSKYELETMTNDQDAESVKFIQRANFDLKTACVLGIGVALLAPEALPIVTIINLPRIGIDIYLKRYHLNRMNKHQQVKERIKYVQDPLFEFMDELRTDYHESNRKLEELKKRANQGENVMQDLLEMMNPERLHLQKISIPIEALKQETDIKKLLEKTNK